MATLAVVRAAERVFRAAASRPRASNRPAERVFDALHKGRLVPVHPSRSTRVPPVCDYVSAACRDARHCGEPLSELAEAVEAVSGQLGWESRATSESETLEFDVGHADARLARSDDASPRILVGVSVVAPGVRYPEHHHPAEEVYIALTPGEWRTDEEPWNTPGAGGVVYTPADAVHTMRAGATPLVAVWLHLGPDPR